MSVESCPQCSGRVTLPAEANADAWARCPLCAAEFPLRRLTEQQPPMLELIEKPGQPLASGEPFAESGASTPTITREDPNSDFALRPGEIAPTLIASSEGEDESDVFRFDDSLLLDEPTDPLLRVTADEGTPKDSRAAVAAMSEADDFDGAYSDAETAASVPAASQFEMGQSNESDPFDPNQTQPYAATPDLPAPERLFGEEIEPAGAAPVENLPQFGLAPRRRARRRNPVVMVGGIVGGGVLGLAIGYGILLWAFDPPKDPLRLAPNLPGFMVPAALRAGGEQRVAQSAPQDVAGDNVDQTDETVDGNAGVDAASEPPLGPPSAQAGSADDSKSSPDLSGDTSTDTTSSATASSDFEPLPDPSIDPLAPAKTAPTATDRGASKPPIDPLANPFEVAPPTEKTQATETSTEAADSTKSSKLPTSPFETDNHSAAAPEPTPAATTERAADSLETLGPVTEKRFSREELLAATVSAKVTTESALAVPVDAPPAQKRKVNGPFYMNLCKVAEALTFLEQPAGGASDDKATTAAIEALLNAVPDKERLEELSKLAGYWLERPQSNGIVLGGIVKDSRPIGGLVESDVMALGQPSGGSNKSGARMITVVSPSALTDDPNRPVLIAGTIVKDAPVNLRGYRGSAETVVWAAMALDPSDPAKAAP